MALGFAALLASAAEPSTAAGPYDQLEDRLRTATAQRKPSDPPELSVDNFSPADGGQTVNLKVTPVAQGSTINYVRLRSSLGSDRIFFAVPGNLVRAYFAGAAVTSSRGGPWSSFEVGAAPPRYPQSVRPDMAIGPPPELLGKQASTWDVIPFNVRTGDHSVVLEYFNVDEKCDVGGVSVKFVELPSHGKLEVGSTEFFAPELIADAFNAKRGDAADSRAKCQLTTFPSIAVQYTPTAEYLGQDSATILLQDHGYESIEHFVFRVLPKVE